VVLDSRVLTGQAGLLVSIDGPGGSGKTTVAALTMEYLTGAGIAARLTTEPSPTPLGTLIRAGTDEYAGMALACLVAGDRHHHLASEIRPALAAGKVVGCDRYVPSSLVLQRMDGLSWDVITALNAGTSRPALAVILNGDPDVIRDGQLTAGAHDGHPVTLAAACLPSSPSASRDGPRSRGAADGGEGARGRGPPAGGCG
jgi:dTMP kinase